MIIPIKRIYLNSGLEVEILLNTDYMIKIEETDGEMPIENPDNGDTILKPRTRIVMDGIGEINVIYTNEYLSTIKGKVTIQRKNSDQVQKTRSRAARSRVQV